MNWLQRYDMDGNPISRDAWAELFEVSNRRIALTQVGEREVSTVWLGLDHSDGDGPPLIFESLVFPEHTHMTRYSTKQEALDGHARLVAQLEYEDEVRQKASE